MTSLVDPLRASAITSLAFGVAGLTWVLARIEPAPRPTTGLRGTLRDRALRQSSLFRLGEPALLRASGWLRALHALPSPRGQRLFDGYVAWQERQLTIAGRAAGLDAYELTALALLCGALSSCTIGLLCARGADSAWWMPAFALGVALPNLRLQSLTAERFKAARRHLPASLDLAALCMSAGADFPRALRSIVEGGDDLIAQELGHVLRGIEVGLTRRAALLDLARRLPAAPVLDLVRALVQAEEKGSPLAETLRNQARMSRLRRSVAAEEAAARAGVLLILPLMLLLGCVVLLLLGPFFVTGGGP